MRHIFRLLLLMIILSITIYASGCIDRTDDSSQLANPAAVFCIEQGNSYDIRTSEDGGQYGICILEDEIECDAWEFYRKACPTCEIWCRAQPHVLCVGTWNITGTYPKCECAYICNYE